MNWRKIEHHAIQAAGEAVASKARVANAELAILQIRADALRNALEVRNALDPRQRSTKADTWERRARVIYDRSASIAIDRNQHRFGDANHTLVTNLISVYEMLGKKPGSVVDASMRAAEVIPRANEAFLAGARAARAWMLEAPQPSPPQWHVHPALGLVRVATRGEADR